MPELRIPAAELRLSFSRSGGKGGQNVNKVATKVTLRWHVASSSALDDEQKARLLRSSTFANRVNESGEVVLHEQRGRQQLENRRLVIEKLHALVSAALRHRKKRKRTRKPRGAIERRLETKRQTAERKRDRRWRPGRGD